MEDGSVIIKVALETGSVETGVEQIEAGCRRAGQAASDVRRALVRQWDLRPAAAAGRRLRQLTGAMEQAGTAAAEPAWEQAALNAGQSAEAAAVQWTRADRSLAELGATMTDGTAAAARYGLGVRALERVLASMCGAVRDGLVSLARYDDQARTALEQLRGALDATRAALITAFVPVTEAVAPLLSRLCSMLVTAANYVSMFFAILGGKSTYKRVASGASGAAAGISTIGAAAAGTAKSVADMGTAAVASYGAMGSAVRIASVSTGELGEKTAAAASGIRTIGQEAKKAERNLTGLDEMNIWQVKEESSTGGGGAGGGGSSGGGGGGLDVPGGGIQFEEVPIDPAFADRISWITDNLDHILTAVAAVGAGLLTWKVASGFGASLRKSAGLAMAVSGAILLGKGSLDAWTKGASWDRLCEQLAGTAGLVGGLGTAFGKTAGAYGGIVSGAFMVINAFKEVIETGDMTLECFVEMEAGIAILGTALSLLTGSWIPAALAAILGLALAAAAYLGGDFSEQVEKEAHMMGIDAAEEGVRSAYETLRKSGASVVEAAEAVGVKAINTTASSADTAWKDWLPAFRRMGYSGSEAVAKGYYDSGMSLQESCIVAGIAGGMAYGTGVETGAEAGMKGMAGSARRHTEAAANAMVEETKRAHRDTSAAFRHLREDGAEHVTGLEEDVEGAYSSMADTVSSDSSSMETDNDSSWSGMKELLLTMTGKMQDKVVSVYAAMGEKISTVMAAAKEKNSDAWTAMANTADKASGAMRGHVERAWGDIPQLAAEALGQAATTAEEKWTAMADTTRNAGGEMKSAAASAWSGVAGAITAKVNELRNSASGWGRDICANLASGLQSGKSRVSSAASSVAGAIRSYLHFSVPDKGPLSDADEYGGDFMRLLSEEMTKNKGRAVSAARTVATAVSEQLGQVTAPGGVETRLAGLTDRLGELASALERLAAPLHGLTAQTPVLATGTVLPPRAVYTEGPVRGLEDMGAGLRQLLGLEAGGERRAEYTFIAQLDRRTLFKEVIAEGKLAQTRTGRNPFDLGG